MGHDRFTFEPGFYRRIFTGIPNEDAIDLASYPREQPTDKGKVSPKIVRSIMLERLG